MKSEHMEVPERGENMGKHIESWDKYAAVKAEEINEEAAEKEYKHCGEGKQTAAALF